MPNVLHHGFSHQSDRLLVWLTLKCDLCGSLYEYEFALDPQDEQVLKKAQEKTSWIESSLSFLFDCNILPGYLLSQFLPLQFHTSCFQAHLHSSSTALYLTRYFVYCDLTETPFLEPPVTFSAEKAQHLLKVFFLSVTSLPNILKHTISCSNQDSLKYQSMLLLQYGGFLRLCAIKDLKKLIDKIWN